MLTRTHAWSRTQKAGIIATTLVALGAFVAFAYSYDRSHRLPDETILVGTWEMTSPPTPGSYTLLRMDEERSSSHWHSGLWIRRDIHDRDGHGVALGASDISWYAGGSYIYMHFLEDPPQIWQIMDIRPEELRLRHARRDYVFKRSPD